MNTADIEGALEAIKVVEEEVAALRGENAKLRLLLLRATELLNQWQAFGAKLLEGMR